MTGRGSDEQELPAPSVQSAARLWGFGKVRYRGLHKNATRAFTALALANIYLARGRLLGQVRP
ncbi:hypothetical protein AcdelDRAFT_3791 [Acidovorax delafieldii 2AN]|uniref:Uncharacterized protein n=1 Tax=Acidovorax delafieldii 2AN TaxID=573060 RepID=C5TA61_ACIDE|nr:hypothetical protein [Acidovorax delafieldii]EER58639.1 hypothetical protein AcdelDRAFT_3791 [Acidovorax delafieldii 2AN]